MDVEGYAQRYGVEPDAGRISTRAWRHYRYVSLVEDLAERLGYSGGEAEE